MSLQEDKARIKEIQFGDPVTNICAGHPSMRHCWFVEYKVKTYRSKFGISHNDYYARCTDKKGKFWDIGIEVIYPGHLDEEKCSELFRPVWEEKYGVKNDPTPSFPHPA